MDLILDACYPRRCVLCRDLDRWPPRWSGGPRVTGLRRFDQPHLCPACCVRLRRPIAPRRSGGDLLTGLPLFGGARTGADLVRVLAELKYRGVRALAWPMSDLVADALAAAAGAGIEYDALVAVPLHRSRRRERGFNHAELLARLAARQAAVPYLARLVYRRRPTAQQARLDATAPDRLTNVSGAFAADDAWPTPQTRLAIVDDLITSGATLGAVAAALQEAGWRVVLGVAAGLAPAPESPPNPSLDTPSVRF